MKITVCNCIEIDVSICGSSSGPGYESTWDFMKNPEPSDCKLVDPDYWADHMQELWGNPTPENMLAAANDADEWTEAVEAAAAEDDY